MLCTVILFCWCRAGIDLVWLDKLWLCFFSLWTFSAIICLKKFHTKKFGAWVLILILFSPLPFIYSKNLIFSSPTDNQVKDIGMTDFLNNKEGLESRIVASNILKETVPYFKSDAKKALGLLLHYNNQFNDEFGHQSGNSTILSNLLKNMWSKPNPFLPVQVIESKDSFFQHLVFFSQFCIGFFAFIIFKDRKSIRRFVGLLFISGFAVGIAGMVQKFSYKPDSNLNEIWGIWDTPEPRYFYASFTYKNHWAAFSLLLVAMGLGLYFKSLQTLSNSLSKRFYSIFYLSGIVVIIATISHCGSRSGVLIIIMFIFLLCLVLVRKFLKIFSGLTLSRLMLLLLSFLLGGLFLSKSTTTEMITNTTSQILQKDPPTRILLWGDLKEQISTKTFWGFGYDSYVSINPIFQSPKVREIRSRLLDNSHQTFVPLVGHGHSDLLEHISEFGWVGFSFSFLPLLLISMRNFLFDPSIFNQSISGGILCFLAYCCIDFPTRSPACLILISLLAGLSLKYNQLSLSK